MGVITISRQYGSEGIKIGRAVAEALDYLYIDKELIVEVASEAKVSVSEVERYDENPEHPALRILKKLVISPYRENIPWEEGWAPGPSFQSQADSEDIVVLDEDSCVQLTQKAIFRLAGRGNVVLMGRGGQALLADRSDVLHIRIEASFEQRIQNIRVEKDLGWEDAEREILKVDSQRRKFLKRHYGIVWDDPRCYHLTVNLGGICGLSTATKIIVAAAKNSF